MYMMCDEGYDAMDSNSNPIPVPSVPPKSLYPDAPFQIIPLLVTIVMFSFIRRKKMLLG